MRSFVLRAAAVALVSCAIPGAASAGWIASGYTNTVLGSTSSDTGTVTYAVYQQSSSGDFFANSGLSSSELSTFAHSIGDSTLNSDKYIFIYEVTNSGGKVSDFFLSNPSSITDVATTNSSTNSVFSTTGSSSGSGTLANPTFTSPTSNPSSEYYGVTAATSNDFEPVTSTPAMQFAFDGSIDSSGGFSGLIIVGSNSINMTGLIQTGDGGYADGYVPVPGPEPSTFALLGLGLPLLGWGYARRLRASKALAAAGV